MKDLYVQASLHAIETDRSRTLQTVWLPLDKNIKEGDQITLKDSEDPTQLWNVDHLWGVTDSTQLNKQREWNNNI